MLTVMARFSWALPDVESAFVILTVEREERSEEDAQI